MQSQAGPIEGRSSSVAPPRAHLMRTIAQIFATELPIGELLAQACVPLALLVDAERVVLAIAGPERNRLVYAWENSAGSPPASDEILPGSTIADVFVRDETIMNDGPGGTSLGVPIRFGHALLGVLAFEAARAADSEAVTLLEACAFQVGARVYYENTLRSSERFAALAYTDGLTAIANRRQFDDTLAREWSRGVRERSPITLLLIDIDYFKLFNDSYGHHAGDVCLQQIARALADGVKRPTDLCARYGGEEFVALLPATELEGGTILGEELREAIAALRIPHSGSTLGRVSLSVGVASYIPTTNTIPSDLVRAADRALYAAKIAGRNRVVASGYESQAKPVERAQAATPNNLPLHATRLIGRRAEILEARTLLERERLVTIVGSSGIGKTRTALQIATESFDSFPDGVWFIDLSLLADRALLAPTIAAVFGAHIGTDESAPDVLARLLGTKRTLLVVDRGAQRTAALSPLLTSLLPLCPHVRVLCISRDPLGIASEKVYRLPLLALPPAGTTATAEDALAYDAVALFVDRAQAVTPSFAFNTANVPAIVRICRQTDGIALAIEIAAARVAVLGVNELAERLAERLRTFPSVDRRGPTRHATLRAFVGWSYDLLPDRERAVFRRLAVFAGRWGLEAASNVVSAEEIEADDVFRLIANLMRKSLVIDDVGRGGETAYRLPAPIREYAAEKLHLAGENERVLCRHAEYFLRLASYADATADATPSDEWLRIYERELDNFRAALEWSLSQQHDVGLGVELSGALSRLQRRLQSANPVF
ncbi:MAG: hypothetical protein NVSMB64_12110 [Candidatus Velthaea sp.]